ncbi:MAG: hypothetical protein AAGC91_12190 [Pseudomonadota bacterium]
MITDPKSVTIVTHADAPEGVADDHVLAAVLNDHEVNHRFAVWSDRTIDWSATTVTIVRSSWDYHLDISRWSNWIDQVETKTQLINSAALLRWNGAKTYLLQLADTGIDVVSTQKVDGSTGLGDLCDSQGWEDVVVKPTVGASSFGVKRFSGDEIAKQGVRHASALAGRGDVIVQPFQAILESEQERSLVYITGRFGHAFQKPSFHSDVSMEALTSHVPSSAELALAEATLAALPEPPVFARIDMIPGSSGPLLMEVELIEPELALHMSQNTAMQLAEVLSSFVASSP